MKQSPFEDSEEFGKLEALRERLRESIRQQQSILAALTHQLEGVTMAMKALDGDE